MHVSLSAEAQEGTCSRCGVEGVSVVGFAVVTETHCGDAEPLCRDCLFDPQGVRANIPLQPLVEGAAPRRKALRKNKRFSREQEVDIATELDWRTQPGSGNQRGAKGDVRGRNIGRVEAKFTQAESFSLKLEELEKIAGECTGFEKPVFVIDFLEPGTRGLRGRYAVFQFDDIKELLHASRYHRGLERTPR